MPVITSTGTADAKYKISQEDVKDFIYNLYSNSNINIDAMIGVFDNSKIATRHFSVPIDWFSKEHSFAEKNRLYIETSIKLSNSAIDSCLTKLNASTGDIDHVIFVSSTGFSTPTIDALLFNKNNFKTHVKRTPIWGLGCAGGAAGLSRAMEYTKAFPESNVMLVSIELCSLTFIKDDISKSNIVAASLFSDGAAAVLVSGDKSKLKKESSIELIDSLSTIYDNSLDVMGWNVVDEGLQVVFSRDIPNIVHNCVKQNILEFLDIYKLTLNDLKHYITHPGGLKVLNAYEESLGLVNGSLNISRRVLKEHGNMSSPSVLYVLDEFLKEKKYYPDEYGLISSLGPGFSSELILFKTL